MIDTIFDLRIKTFLTLCEEQSFTKAAQKLFITQPAVTQQISSLQKEVGKKLYTIENRVFNLTKEGHQLRQFLISLSLNIKKFGDEFYQMGLRKVKFGATRTIGEFTLPPIIEQMVKHNGSDELFFHIDNTEVLLKMLDKGKIDFAFIEGQFDKSAYSYKLFTNHPFIAIGSKRVFEKYKGLPIESLLNERLIVREEGSGTRRVLEQILKVRGFKITDFKHVDVVANLNVIKHLVKNDLGVSFLYEDGAKRALGNGEIYKLQIKDLEITREFNFVYPLNSLFEEQLLHFYGDALKFYSTI
ncbi:MAG: LysR substrate-binding domain-containing protein [Sphaerochaetaceae bacterium]